MSTTTHAPPRIAAGPLAGLLPGARDGLEDSLDARTVVAGPSARPFLLALMAERAAPLFVVAGRESDAETLADALSSFLGDGRVAYLPAWETLPHERLSPQPATVGQRLAVLDRLVRPDAYDEPLAAVVIPVRAALQPMDPKLAERAPLHLTLRYDGGFDGLLDTLVELGYSRATQVEARGDFAVRGGIVDVFPAAAEHPVRLEFWGDDVESLREFAVADQRSIGDVEDVRVEPARELVVDEDTRRRARERAERIPALRDSLGQLADGVMFEGVESLVTLLYPRPALITDFLPDRGGLAVVDPIVVRERADKVREEAEILLEASWETAAGHRPEDAGYVDLDVLLGRVQGETWEMTPFAPGGDLARSDGAPTAEVDAFEPWPSYRGDVSGVADRARRLLGDGYRVVGTTRGHGPAQRLSEVLREQGAPVSFRESLAMDHSDRTVEVVPSLLAEGFLAPSLGLAVLGETDVFGVRPQRRAGRRLGTRSSAKEAVLDLELGDHVVHRVHGVGIYRGMQTRDVRTPAGTHASRDYVLLEYAKGDRLYVPSDQVAAISRYTGADKPSVMRLGGAEWERAKNRVRGEVRDIAADLIRLYTARMHAEGYAFDNDGAWQAELEDAFEFVETGDQLEVIEEIKRDMEAPLPMDRLLTGDVGFGKTEVAVRAAGKALFEGKQVAVLVPTTLLAQQHFETFRERFAGFPVEIRMLSRFVTGVERRDIIGGIADGTVDLVIGTHALFGRNVRFKDLGLVIVDEEQRFGVKHKERLKELRASVDVLTMSATPIPRTLEMAVSGIRDLSVIETPPEDRQPIHTVVAPYDDGQVALALRRELLREGQVFYVHNQVDTIQQTAEHLRELVPDARIAVAHGQMDERELERVMIDFWRREFDVLVCTTIIESGLDVPNANTLVVERADLLGLAQLHQLRGRVGRSTERGYAYLFFPENASMTEAAYQRLETVGEHTRLGAGLAIALRDLQIRGAGNVVGAEQSGHVAAVGFETFSQMLKEEVAEMTGRELEQPIDVKLELPVDAHLPSDYVSDEKLRLELYAKISAVRNAGDVNAVRAELVDRFGRLPQPAERLLTMAALKAALDRWGLEEVALLPNRALRASPVVLSQAQQVRLDRLYPDATWRATSQVLEVPLPATGVDDLVAWTARTLRDVLATPKKQAS